MAHGNTGVVALESTVIAHGLPYPHNIQAAMRLEEIVREEGAEPRTLGVVGGAPVNGLSAGQIERFGASEGVRKVSVRDLPVVMAGGLDGATTVAATMVLAHRFGIEVFATGGIGGVHRSRPGEPSFDVSADLNALARYPMIVVCAGAKAVLDLPATREVLETCGVTVVGYQTGEMAAFYSRNSGLPVDTRCDTPEEAAAVFAARRSLDLPGAVLVTAPVPVEAEIPEEVIRPAIERALVEADQRGLRSAEVTPFLLDRLRVITGERTLRTNVALLENNVRIAARIAAALARMG